MPLYFFHLNFGERILPDEEGVELPSRIAAQNEARAVIRDLSDDRTSDRRRHWGGWFLEVEDHDGLFLRMPIGWPPLELVSRQLPAASRNPEQENLRPPHAADNLPLPSYRQALAAIAQGMRKRREQTEELLKWNYELRQALAAQFTISNQIRGRTRALLDQVQRSGPVAGPPHHSASV